MKHANRALTVLIFIFLYIPMAVLIVASFNTGKDITHFDGFTFNQYLELFKDDNLLNLLANSLIISSLATATATVFGTVAAVGINRLNPKLRKVAMSLTNIPMTNPDIVKRRKNCGTPMWKPLVSRPVSLTERRICAKLLQDGIKCTLSQTASAESSGPGSIILC